MLRKSQLTRYSMRAAWERKERNRSKVWWRATLVRKNHEWKDTFTSEKRPATFWKPPEMSLIIVKLSWKLSSLKCKYGDHMNGGFIPLCLSEGTYPNLKMALYIFKHQYLLKAVGVIQYLWVKIPQQAFKTQLFNKPDILGRCRVYFLIHLPIKYPKTK